MRIVLILLSLWAWNAAKAGMTLLKPTAAAPDGRARVALVAGIASYPELSSTNAFETLTHPLNDAQDIAAELQRYGFYIILLKDATQKEFESAVNCFASDCEDNWRIKGGSVALFYYSGHGLVVLDKGKKTNFVMPKRGFKDAADVKEYGFSTNWLLNKMKSAQIKLMFLDACRSEKSLLEKKGFSDEEAGFVKMDLDKFEEKGMSNQNVQGIIVGYASQEGKPAIGHKQQRNSFYTTGLLEMLRNNGHQTVDRLLKLTADRVFDLSMNIQMPWDDRRLIGDFCFGNCGGEKVFIPPQQPVKPEKVIQPEVKPVEIPVKTYILQVRADVSDAEIIIDNQILGKTPLDVELKEGSHEIVVKYNGQQAKQTMNIQANRDFNVEFGKAVSPITQKVGETSKDCLNCPEIDKQEQLLKNLESLLVDSADPLNNLIGAVVLQRMDTQAKELQKVQGVENVKYDQQQQTINAELKVLFDIDQSYLKPTETIKLDNLASVFMKYPENIIMIEGHTNSTGSESHNLQLSLRRALSVESYLRGKNLDIASLGSAGYGSAHPVASNTTAAGREQNRRLEIKISVDPNRIPQQAK